MSAKWFRLMTPPAAKFYSAVFNNVLLNIWAVRNGHFDVLLCDTADPDVPVRWREVLPMIQAIAIASSQRKPPDGH